MKKKIILIIYELNKFQKIFYNLFYIMKFSLEKFNKDFEKNFLLYSFLIVILILGVYYYYNYINKKSKGGYEGNTSSPNSAYSNQSKSSQNTLPQASQPLGQNEVYDEDVPVETIEELINERIVEQDEYSILYSQHGYR